MFQSTSDPKISLSDPFIKISVINGQDMDIYQFVQLNIHLVKILQYSEYREYTIEFKTN